jgi:hypothetical protein
MSSPTLGLLVSSLPENSFKTTKRAKWTGTSVFNLCQISHSPKFGVEVEEPAAEIVNWYQICCLKMFRRKHSTLSHASSDCPHLLYWSKNLYSLFNIILLELPKSGNGQVCTKPRRVFTKLHTTCKQSKSMGETPTSYHEMIILIIKWCTTIIF